MSIATQSSETTAATIISRTRWPASTSWPVLVMPSDVNVRETWPTKDSMGP